MKKYRCVVWFEDEFTPVKSFDTPAELTAFMSGVSLGSGAYGGDGCGVYTLEDLRGDEQPYGADKETVETAIRRLTK
jgi:hypothetical protein